MTESVNGQVTNQTEEQLEATKFWRKHHAQSELVSPDMGTLLRWLMNEAGLCSHADVELDCRACLVKIGRAILRAALGPTEGCREEVTNEVGQDLN